MSDQSQQTECQLDQQLSAEIEQDRVPHSGVVYIEEKDLIHVETLRFGGVRRRLAELGVADPYRPSQTPEKEVE